MLSSPKTPGRKQRRRPSILVALAWYAPEIQLGIARYAQEADWILDLRMTHGNFTLKGWSGDGAITLLPWSGKGCAPPAAFTRPVVNIGDVELPGIPLVRYDDEAIGRMAADHFVERGFSNFAFLKRADNPLVFRRLQAYARRAGEVKNAHVHLVDITGRFSQSGYESKALIKDLRRELAALPKPLALFTSSDEAACDLLHACRSLNVAVPEEIAVLGVNNNRFCCDFAPVPLSSVDINLEMSGYKAAALLDDLLKGKAVVRDRVPSVPPPVLISPVGVVARQSTDILTVKHPHVAAAMRHIWENYAGNINAKTVAATVPLSYPTLGQAFLRHVGRTVAEEITHKRLERARFLLVNTNRLAGDIAKECGFTNDDRMGRIFRQKLGITPSGYRKENRKPLL